MPRTPKNVIGSWHLLIENYSTSAKDFYEAVEEAVTRREIPEATTSRVEWSESGVGSAKREYLRVARGGLAFDICAAPFGTGYFFSWWALRPISLFHRMVVLGIIIGTPLVLLMFASSVGSERNPFAGCGAIFLVFLILPALYFIGGLLLRENVIPGEDVVLDTPYVGALYEALFAPNTIYRLDTALMFQESVRSAVNEVIEGLRNQQGLRALTPEELRPRMIGLGS